MVRKHIEIFRNISPHSVLFYKDFYHKCLNINTINVKNLMACSDMHYDPNIPWNLLTSREHTFDELFMLYNLSQEYVQLYESLSISRVDERLRIMREIVKDKCLPEETNIEELAKMLSQKPLSKWIQDDLNHITEISKVNAVRLLGDYKSFFKFIPDIMDNAELRYLLDHKEQSMAFSSMADIRKNILDCNEEWKYLINLFGFSEQFIVENSEHIKKFLYEDGAYIIKTYHESNTKKTEELRRLVSAELMGRFKELKYYHNDLTRELDYPLSKAQRRVWMNNTKEKFNRIVVYEEDGFLPVMKLGTIPYATCLSYITGTYNQCLLACHDSNKKVLYLTYNGRIVLRASIRLTKGTYQDYTNKASEPQLEFADLMANYTAQKAIRSNRKEEYLTLFLERPYVSGLPEKMIRCAYKLIFSLMKKKAKDMNALLVTSIDYQQYLREELTPIFYSMYISKSKAGEQYLDSLDGNNRANKEGTYFRQKFLIEKQKLSSSTVISNTH